MRFLQRDVVYAPNSGRIICAQPDREQADVGEILCLALLAGREDLLPDGRGPSGIIARVDSIDNVEFASVDI
jgi:hypothetical protein